MDDFERKLSELHDRVIGNALSDEERANYSESLFDSIKHKNKSGEEFWYARELQIALEYTEWRNFSKVIERAKTSCQNSGNTISDHFVEFNKIVKAGATTKKIVDIELSRYACYLIVQNGDSRKKVIALGQTYFAVKTRQQELIENFDNLTEEKKRLAIRGEMISHNKSLAEAAKMAGIRLRRDHITGKEEANQTHFDVGQKVRQTIKDLGGTMPENLPTPKKSIKQIEKEQRNLKE